MSFELGRVEKHDSESGSGTRCFGKKTSVRILTPEGIIRGEMASVLPCERNKGGKDTKTHACANY